MLTRFSLSRVVDSLIGEVSNGMKWTHGHVTEVFVFILFPLLLESMFDDIRLRVARSYTPPPPPPTVPSLYSFTHSIQPSSLNPSLNFFFPWTFFAISPTFVVPLIFTFTILSGVVTRHIHHIISISAISNFISCACLMSLCGTRFTVNV